MAAGLFGYMAYDMVRLVERLPDANPDRLALPDAVFLRPTVVALFDHIEDRITIVTPVWPSPDLSAARRPTARPASGWLTRSPSSTAASATSRAQIGEPAAAAGRQRQP